ncbi:hypothetical protein, partial [Vibrio sp. 10N.239.312.D08]|uniref:hypothetical protein n=1 Tax=Vibrio sp. 10N.239.312.D08 TaxID=3229978 RepID=UPI00354FF47E
ILLKQFMIAHYRAVMPNPYPMGHATQAVHDRSLPCSDAEPLSEGHSTQAVHDRSLPCSDAKPLSNGECHSMHS